MQQIKRFGVSMEEKLLARFDRYISENNYKNRSEALRDLIRKELVQEEWLKSKKDVAGAIILVYDHHRKELMDNLVHLQHQHQEIIISSQHIHLDHRICLEVVIVKGRIDAVYALESKLKAAKGVKHAALAQSTMGRDI